MSGEYAEDLQIKVQTRNPMNAQHISENILVFRISYSCHNRICR